MYRHYNMNQIVLPLNLVYELDENDIAFPIHALVESIPDSEFSVFRQEDGRPAFNPRMMFKIILCAYTQSIFSGRKIEAALKDSIRMRWLSQGQCPSYRTINRFRSDRRVRPVLEACFIQFRSFLVKNNLIDEEAIFIDGTKIEANANKYSFVWKRGTDRYEEQLNARSKALYEELVEKEILPAIQDESPEVLDDSTYKKMEEALEKQVFTYTEEIEKTKDVQKRKQMRHERKEPKLQLKQVRDFRQRKEKYRQQREILGERNSYSKTDHDATFMRLKEDHMRNGQLKPAYNLQIATNEQYVLGYDLFPNPTDTRTFIPFLKTLKDRFSCEASYVVADAGYGSETNYRYVLEETQSIPLITYSTYEKEQKKKFKKDPLATANWPYDETTDAFTCANGRILSYQYTEHRRDRYGTVREFRYYACENCEDCLLRKDCSKAKGDKNRRLRINPKWESYKHQVKGLLKSPETGEIYSRRKIDVEPAFGRLKSVMHFKRLSLRGIEKARNELGFALMASNLRKLIA